jgi:hypothetical protein
MLRTTIILTSTLLILAATGLVHGLWTDRWEVTEEPRRSQARIYRVPLSLGDWDGRDMEIDFSQIPEEISGQGYVRRYVNRVTGDVVTMYLTCGRPGHISIHTPPVCYPAGGYSLPTPPTRYLAPVESGGKPVEMWLGKFVRSSGPITEHLRVFWTWSAARTWHAPDSPRWTFAHYPALYKVYVINQLIKGDEPIETDPSLAFLKVLIPVLERELFPTDN